MKTNIITKKKYIAGFVNERTAFQAYPQKGHVKYYIHATFWDAFKTLKYENKPNPNWGKDGERYPVMGYVDSVKDLKTLATAIAKAYAEMAPKTPVKKPAAAKKNTPKSKKKPATKPNVTMSPEVAKKMKESKAPEAKKPVADKA